MWPFRSKGTPEVLSDLSRFSDNLISAHSIGLLGACSDSPDRAYTVVCQDNDYQAGRGGARDSGHGRIVLLSGQRLLWDRPSQRPNGGHVADNGTVVVADWMFTQDLSSKILAFDVHGRLLLEQQFTANAFNVGLSRDAHFAAIQLCNSRTEDSSKLNIFDLQTGGRLGNFVPVIGWANGYDFDGAAGTISLINRHGRSYRFKFDGTFLDEERHQKERLADASPTEVVLIVEERLRSGQGGDSQQLLSLLQRAESQGLARYPDYLATACRIRGDLQEQMGQPEAAAAAYRKALALNPKIGVKKKLAAIEKRMVGK